MNARTHARAHTLLSTAAAALDELSSPHTALRAHLHAEVARCELAADFLSKAASQVGKAMALDYGKVTPAAAAAAATGAGAMGAAGGGDGGAPPPPASAGSPDPAAQGRPSEGGAGGAAAAGLRGLPGGGPGAGAGGFAGLVLPPPPALLPADASAVAADANRSLDRFLVPLQRRLQLRSALYSEPSNPLDAAALVLEQVSTRAPAACYSCPAPYHPPPPTP